MTSIDRLQAEVEDRWSRRDTPSWPDPHTGGRDSLPEEYERVTDPDRYRIVHERARLWAQVLAAHGARAEELPPRDTPAWSGEASRSPVDRLVRIDPPVGAVGALPLFLCETDGYMADGSAVVGNPERDDGGSSPGNPVPPTLRIAWGGTDMPLAEVPDCGCDACDHGSADLLEAVDDTVRHAVEDTVRLAGRHSWPVRKNARDWHLTWHADGSAQGSGTFPGGHGIRRYQRDRDAWWRMNAACEQIARGERPPLPRGTELTVGRAWFPEDRG